MGLGSGTNALQSAVIRRTLGRNKVLQTVCAVGVALTDIGSAMLSKLDWTTASASSRIDQIIRDSLDHQAEASEQRTAVVTGANSGIGYETAKALGRAGYFTILACRSMELGSEAVERLERETGLAGRFEVMQVDLASLASVRGFVSGIKARGCKVSILVNNGGVACPYMRTTDGIEMQFGTNHVGHFALTLGLLDSGSISRSEARIVIVSSMAAFMVGRMDYRAVSEEARFSSMQNYALSKLANMTFARALAGRLAGSGTTVSVVTPGAVATNLSRHGATHGFERALLRALFVDAPTGAICSIYAALSPEVSGELGTFFSHCLPMAMHPMALDEDEQERLWAYTEDILNKQVM